MKITNNYHQKMILKNNKYFRFNNVLLHDNNINQKIISITESVSSINNYEINIEYTDSYTKSDRKVTLVPKTNIEKIKLKFIFKLFWLQKEENIRYIVNILFLIIGTYLTFKQID